MGMGMSKDVGLGMGMHGYAKVLSSRDDSGMGSRGKEEQTPQHAYIYTYSRCFYCGYLKEAVCAGCAGYEACESGAALAVNL